LIDFLNFKLFLFHFFNSKTNL